MEDIKNRIEAVLFTTGRFIETEELAELCNIGSKGTIKEALTELINDYKNKNSALEIVEEKNKFKLNIKKDYLYLTTKLLNETEFDKPTQETLALVALKQPVIQAEIIHIRGNKAYDHIKKLKELDFLTSEKKGRSRLLKTAPKFYDYFDVVGESQIKEKFSEIEQKYQNETQD
ncbi:SMC-Scp complex subunit ScpB [archaeon]|nr:SMC-Scp complex subunit ScpB [archaeon]